VISGPSSSGKSSIANIICKFDTSFIKLNTKRINIISEQMLSHNYFARELDVASIIIGKNIASVSDVFTETQKCSNKALLDISKTLSIKLSDLDPQVYLDILYQNYVLEVEGILERGNRCIIDHNIFLDPHPLKKDIFFKHFKHLDGALKVINIYSNFENVILNTLDRNNRFYNFINTHERTNSSKTELERFDEQMGFSHLVFRQPLRIIENLFSMYRFTDSHSTKTLQIIRGRDLQQMLDIAQYEQEKLIGFLVYKNYIFTHISDEELLSFRSDFVIPDITDRDIYVEDERFRYDVGLITDYNLNGSHFLNSLMSSKDRVMDCRSEANTQLLLQKINMLHGKVQRDMALSLEGGGKDLFIDSDECPLYSINNFLDNNVLSDIVKDIMSRRGKRSILYPIAVNVYSQILLNNEALHSIEMQVSFSEGAGSKDFHEYDNNLIFLARLYSALKLNGLFNTEKFKGLSIKYCCRLMHTTRHFFERRD
jgi:hypothetical protein